MSPMTALRLSPAWDDPEAVRTVVRGGGPFWPLARYAANDAEMQALGPRRATFTPPWFRLDFALAGTPLVDGASLLLANPRFRDAARTICGTDVFVRPTTVYVNVMGPTPFAFPPHLDVPAFRGFTRADYPVWILKVMKTSGLFERWRTKIVTSVSWLYDGPGGEFHYWPEGPGGPVAVESPPFTNVSVVADNETTFHGVAPLGPPDARMPDGLSVQSRLVRGDGGWDVCDADGTEVAHFDDAEVRITISWKADVFADEGEASCADAGDDSLELERVVAVFADDLRSRGIDAGSPADPLRDETWIRALASTYRDAAPVIG